MILSSVGELSWNDSKKPSSNNSVWCWWCEGGRNCPGEKSATSQGHCHSQHHRMDIIVIVTTSETISLSFRINCRLCIVQAAIWNSLNAQPGGEAVAQPTSSYIILTKVPWQGRILDFEFQNFNFEIFLTGLFAVTFMILTIWPWNTLGYFHFDESPNLVPTSLCITTIANWPSAEKQKLFRI